MESLKHVYRVAFLELWTWTRQVYSCIILYNIIYICIYIYLWTRNYSSIMSVYRHMKATYSWNQTGWHQEQANKDDQQQHDLSRHFRWILFDLNRWHRWLVLSAAVDDLHSPKITNGSMRCSSRLRSLDAVIPSTRAAGERWKDHFLHDATKLEKGGHLYKHER